MRFLPVQTVCYASLTEIAAAVKPLIDSAFPEGSSGIQVCLLQSGYVIFLLTLASGLCHT